MIALCAAAKRRNGDPYDRTVSAKIARTVRIFKKVRRMCMKEELPMAVILAGGRGQRLSPLTDDCPKPLLPLCGKPILQYTLEDLEEAGCRKALILTGYLGERFEECFGRRLGKTELLYHREESSNGSAAALKGAAALLEDRFFLLCADGYGKRDYRALDERHRENNAAVTILCHAVDDPEEFGLAITEADGRVTAFLEKPDWSQATTNLANIGVYLMEKKVLSLIPEGKADIAGDLFLRILEAGLPFYSMQDHGIWQDIGTPRDLLAVNLLENGGKSVFGAGCQTEGSRITRSLLFDGVTVGAGSVIEGAVLGTGCHIGRDCTVELGCVIAPGCQLPDGQHLKADSRYDGSGRLFFPDLKEYFGEGGIHSHGKTLPRRFWTHLGQTIAAVLPFDGMPAVMYACGGEPASVAGEILDGLLKNTDVVDSGEGMRNAANYLAVQKHFPITLYIYKDRIHGMSVLFFDANGLPPGKAYFRRLRDAFGKEAKADSRMHSAYGFGGLLFYQEMLTGLLRRGCGDLSSRTVGVSERSLIGDTLKNTLLSVSIRTVPPGKGEIDLQISSDGKNARLSDDSGSIDMVHIGYLLLEEELRAGNRVTVLPASAPEVYFCLAERYTGKRPEALPRFPLGEEMTPERAELGRRRYTEDGCFAVLSVLEKMLRERRTCADLLAGMPDFSVSERNFDCAEEEKMALMMGGHWRAYEEGMGAEEEKGRLRVIAHTGRGFRLLAEAGSDADAAEILERARKKLNELKKLNRRSK